MPQARSEEEVTATLDTLVTDLETYIRDALDIIESGEYVELNGLDEKVADLCRQVTEIPLAKAKNFQPKLSAIIKQLDLLQSILCEHRDKVEEQLQGLQSTKRASQAYAKSDAIAGIKPSKKPD